jgi:nucleoside phosphorylase
MTMLSRTPDQFSLSNLKDLDPAGLNWFSEKSPAALAGRCLLDALEYLRAVPPFSAEFREVTNAHAIRLVCQCLSDPDLQGGKVLQRMKPHILRTCKQLREARKNEAPHYGDDFWDWAMVVEALIAVYTCFPNEDGLTLAVITDELTAFHNNVEAKIAIGLTIPANKKKEWYGPATAAAAHHLLNQNRNRLGGRVGNHLLVKLKAQALQLIASGKYRKRNVTVCQTPWHYGQVVAEFPDDAKKQAKEVNNFAWMEKTANKDDRAYALARVLQGAAKIENNKSIRAAMKELYECEDQGRPLGQGLMADNVKGSLNVLEALWPMLKPDLKGRLQAMLDALIRTYLKANTIGILVAIKNEDEAAKKVFIEAGARVEKEEPGTTVFAHENYRVVVCGDKAVMGAPDATKKLIDTHKVKWLIMFGIAGSLAEFVAEAGKPKLVDRGPDIGDVVIATSLAPFRIYQKIRQEIESARVPFRGQTWGVIPTDPILFGLAHEVTEQLGDKGFHEGLIVTGTGVVDLGDAKADVLKEFPGGLAAETEGYMVGLICLLSGVPYLVIRGISDPADGSKKQQTREPEREKREQLAAAVAAGRVAAGVAALLAQRW